MKLGAGFAVALLLIAGVPGTVLAEENLQDPRAMEVLNRMVTYTSAIDQLVIEAEVHADARMDAGLMVSNAYEINIRLDRPGSIRLEKFDGINTSKVVIHEGQLTVYNSDNNFFARASVPENIQQAMQFAMDEYDLETPLAEFFFADSVLGLLTSQDKVLYLADKSLVRGVNCHQLAVRGEKIDLQLWVEEGEKPTPRKILMTMKWDGGSPRSVAYLAWKNAEGFEPGVFEFVPPEGAQQIRFLGSDTR